MNADTGRASGLDYDARLCAAEVRIISDDLKLLLFSDMSDNHVRGLHKRIKSAAATLPWLCQRYALKNESSPQLIDKKIQIFIDHYYRNNLESAYAAASELVDLTPINYSSMMPNKASKKLLLIGKSIYVKYCSSCHENPNLDLENPAFSLFASARHQPASVFISRMIGGVRGTHEIGLRNPLSDSDISAMYAYFLAGNSIKTLN